MQPEVKPRSVQDARRDRDTQPARHQRMTGAVAGAAPFGPCLATAAAVRAGGAQQHRDRHDGSAVSFLGRQADLRLHRVAALAGRFGEKRAAYAGYEMGDRRKIDRDLISEAVGLALQSHAG